MLMPRERLAGTPANAIASEEESPGCCISASCRCNAAAVNGVLAGSAKVGEGAATGLATKSGTLICTIVGATTGVSPNTFVREACSGGAGSALLSLAKRPVKSLKKRRAMNRDGSS